MTNVLLWMGQGLLAAVFLFSSAVKGTQPKKKIISMGQTGVVFLPLWLIRFTAAAELAGAIGVIVPWASGIARVLTPVAAIGLGLTMVLAGISHLKLREPLTAAGNLVILLVCTGVAAGRFADL